MEKERMVNEGRESGFIKRNMTELVLLIFVIIVALATLLPVSRMVMGEYYDNTSVVSKVNVTNAPPTLTVDYFYNNESDPSDTITLVEAGTTVVYCNGTVNDNNGWEDISSVNGTIYAPGFNAESPDDKNSHYTNASCAFAQENTTAVKAVCTFQVYFFANNGSWTCNMTAIDGDNATASDVKSNTVEPLFAIELNTTVIDYGELEPGQSTASDSPVEVKNTGNMDINLSVEGYGAIDGDNLAMVCDLGNISIEEEKYDITPGQAISSMYNLSDNPLPAGIPGLTIIQNQDDNGNSTNSTYWKLHVPTGAGRGFCNGTVIFEAVF